MYLGRHFLASINKPPGRAKCAAGGFQEHLQPNGPKKISRAKVRIRANLWEMMPKNGKNLIQLIFVKKVKNDVLFYKI